MLYGYVSLTDGRPAFLLLSRMVRSHSGRFTNQSCRSRLRATLVERHKAVRDAVSVRPIGRWAPSRPEFWAQATAEAAERDHSIRLRTSSAYLAGASLS